MLSLPVSLVDFWVSTTLLPGPKIYTYLPMCHVWCILPKCHNLNQKIDLCDYNCIVLYCIILYAIIYTLLVKIMRTMDKFDL